MTELVTYGSRPEPIANGEMVKSQWLRLEWMLAIANMTWPDLLALPETMYKLLIEDYSFNYTWGT